MEFHPIFYHTNEKPLENGSLGPFFFSGQLESKPFGFLMSIGTVVSVKSLLTETTLTIDSKMPNCLSFGCISRKIPAKFNTYLHTTYLL